MSWAEELMSRRGLTRCPLCPGTNPVIGFDGPIDSPALFVGSKPGKEENNRGKAFVGQTGKELNSTYLPLCGMPRETVRFANAGCCYHEMPDDSDKAIELMFSCAYHHLRPEIIRNHPKVIVPMGAAACRLVEGLDLERQHGIPMIGTKWWGVEADTFATYHPAAGLHATDIMTELLEDFEALGQFMRGELTAPVDEYPDPDYRILVGGKQVDAILYEQSIYDIIYVDTEFEPDAHIIVDGKWYRDKIYCLSFCFRPGTGYIIKASDEAGLAAFVHWMMNVHKGQVCYHSALADIPMLEQVGVTTPIKRVDDTMERSYLLQRTPQGLKALAYRLCGMATVSHH